MSRVYLSSLLFFLHRRVGVVCDDARIENVRCVLVSTGVHPTRTTVRGANAFPPHKHILAQRGWEIYVGRRWRGFRRIGTEVLERASPHDPPCYCGKRAKRAAFPTLL